MFRRGFCGNKSYAPKVPARKLLASLCPGDFTGGINCFIGSLSGFLTDPSTCFSFISAVGTRRVAWQQLTQFNVRTTTHSISGYRSSTYWLSIFPCSLVHVVLKSTDAGNVQTQFDWVRVPLECRSRLHGCCFNYRPIKVKISLPNIATVFNWALAQRRVRIAKGAFNACNDYLINDPDTNTPDQNAKQHWETDERRRIVTLINSLYLRT